MAKDEDYESPLWKRIREELKRQGIDADALARGESCLPASGEIKVICLRANLQDSVDDLGRQSRDQVVMVRVDEATSRDLDAWVETAAVRSRSEAAALFIREGLRMRSAELEKLRGALTDVERARERLRTEVSKLFPDKKKVGES